MAKELRQGDVLLIRIDPIDLEAERKRGAKIVTEAHDKGFAVLAYGEVTGHSHKVKGEIARVYQVDGERYLRVSNDTELLHEEHGQIPLEAGDYKVIRQREYTPRENVWVRD